MNIYKINLNLLIALDALLTEEHVSRAAEQVHITQSAMSNALNQLRELFNDEILIRGPKKMIPTDKAKKLAPEVRRIIEQVNCLIKPEKAFDPLTSTREFIIGASDHVDLVLMPAIIKLLCKQAPNIKIHIVHVNQVGESEPFESGCFEIAIGAVGHKSKLVHTEKLIKFGGIVAARKDHPLMKTKMTLKKYISAKHIRVVYHSQPLQSIVDDSLKKLGVKRDFIITVPHMVPALFALADSNLICSFPTNVETVAHQNGLITQPLPFHIPDVYTELAWHKQADADPGHAWMRNLIKQAADQI